MSVTSNFSFSSQYLSHPFASSDANIHHASSDASPIYLSIQFSFPSRPCVQTWLSYQSNRFFKPFLHQFFIPNVNWPGLTKSYVKSMTSVTTRTTIICKSLTAPCPSPTTPTCSHYTPEVEAYHPDDPTGAVFSRSLSPDQHHPDRQLRLSLSPEQIEVLVSLCLPKARARRNGDTDHAPQSRKG